ncbi:hypothetical protein QJS10_CPB04g01000 [Acorus calamus]|uniref:Uncharacterized protein n=1 Tax=Acorus calamus TaxID=4465 RepID=A0AAV9F2C9_ACOCL|nr:hypothetical protein QJS10_CPB04g01000 [Acorus calamus]
MLVCHINGIHFKVEGSKKDGGPIDPTIFIWGKAKEDFLLLENQIPFFVVKALFELFIANPHKVDRSPEELAIILMESRYIGKRDSPPTIPNGDNEVHHLLHLIYLTILPTVTQLEGSGESSNNPTMAIKFKKKGSYFINMKNKPPNMDFDHHKLKEAGVKFKALKNPMIPGRPPIPLKTPFGTMTFYSMYDY